MHDYNCNDTKSEFLTDIGDISSLNPLLDFNSSFGVEERIEDEINYNNSDSLKLGEATLKYNESKNDYSAIDNPSVVDYESSFDVEVKLYGIIQEVDFEAESISVLFKDEANSYSREAVLSFSDLETGEESKAVKGAKLIYLYGKLYVKGTAYNFSKVVFRAENTWNKFKLGELKRASEELLKIMNNDF